MRNMSGENRKQIKKINKDHIFHKRQPKKPERGENILYINSKTNIKAQLEKCNKLVGKNESEIILYCLGAAIQRGILLVLQFCECHMSYNFETSTFSTELIDDLEPTIDDADYEIQKRFNSALRIRIFRTDLLETIKKTNA